MKAQWIKDNEGNVPPKTHNLQHIASQTKLQFDENVYSYLAVISSWNTETRYPDYKLKMYKTATGEYNNVALIKVEKIKKWMLNQLQ